MTNIAVFDFDGTIIRGDSVLSLVLYAHQHKCIAKRDLLRAGFFGALYALRLVPAMKAKEASHAFLAKMHKNERNPFLQDFAKTLVDRAYPEALAQIAEHQKKGELVLLCSASCHSYMQYVAKFLNVDALVCTPSAYHGEALGPNCRGEEKARRIDVWLKENGCENARLIAGYGDSGADAHILSRCLSPVLVNPKRALVKRMPGARIVSWKR